MNIYCAKDIQGQYVFDYGFLADSEAQAIAISDAHDWQYLGPLDEQNVSELDKALIERDFLDCPLH